MEVNSSQKWRVDDVEALATLELGNVELNDVELKGVSGEISDMYEALKNSFF
jgi:hypothetical protein